jgi:hypothetical protein
VSNPLPLNTYFPEYLLTHSRSTGFRMDTVLRKKHKAIWYKILVTVWGTDKEDVLKKFLTDVYNAALFMKIDPELKHSGFGAEGEAVFPVDELQIEESHRLKPKEWTA